MGTAFLVAAIALSAGCAALCYAHLRQVRGVASPDLRALTASLRRTPEVDRLDELARRSRPGTWEHRLASEMRGAPIDRARVAVINDALADAELSLVAGAAWPPAAFRLCTYGSLLLAIAAFLAEGFTPAIPVVAVTGAAGAIACVEIRRRARHEARAQREAIDALIAAVAGPLLTPGGDARGAAGGNGEPARAARGPGPSRRRRVP